MTTTTTTTTTSTKKTSTETSTLHKRQRTSSSERHQRLFRPNASHLEVFELLERKDLTTQEILAYCTGSPVPEQTESQAEYNDRVGRYRARRVELQELNQKLHRGGNGGVHVDEHGRLMPFPPPTQQQPPPNPPPRPGRNPPEDERQRGGVPRPPAARGVAVAPAHMFGQDNDEMDQQLIRQQQEREAAEVIARAVQLYREQGVDDADLVLLRVPDHHTTRINFLRVRRICFAVAAVVGAFLLILMKTLPPAPRNNHLSNPVRDRLMDELLHVKLLAQHAKECPQLHRLDYSTWWDYWLRMIGFSQSIDCSDGVLHIPSTTVIIDEFIKAKTIDKVSLLEPFVTNGVNVTWYMDCVPTPTVPQETCYPGKTNNETVCRSAQPCFRGVHDAVITKRQVEESLRFGSALIVSGGDHFDIRYDTDLLEERLLSVVERLRSLLSNTYNLGTDIQPVAYRVNGVAPMDGSGVNIYGIRSSDYLVRILNRTNYIKWMDRSDQRNDLAQFSLPWPFRIKPVRDTCNLMADMEADPRFAIHTTVFLSDGAGEEYQGGVALYVDHHRSNRNSRRWKIRRGLAVDGTRGRVIVSTGGLENSRCRLPTRAGVRATLQIWWNCNA